MKLILGAFALVIAAPVAGQSTPATDPHAGHHSRQGMDHIQHQKGEHDCKECCEKMKGEDGMMECKDKKVKAKPVASEHDHGGHAH